MSLPPTDVDPAIRTAQTRDFYQAYLNSPGWKTRRNKALRDCGWRCSRCPSKRSLEVHHLNYERLGAERDSDLEVLCSTCHRGEHLERPEQTGLGIYLKMASAAVMEDPFSSIANLVESVRVACAKLKIPSDYERINSAISVVCGNRLKMAAKAPQEMPKAEPRAFSKAEAYESVCRVMMAAGMKESPIRQIPVGKRSPIDIYAPVRREDYGDHDLY